jgi:uncharacterized protein YdhG (YjbR/CyaY superfamily)
MLKYLHYITNSLSTQEDFLTNQDVKRIIAGPAQRAQSSTLGAGAISHKESSMPARKQTKKPATNTPARGTASQGLSAEERAAMKETLKERKLALNKEDAEKAVLEKIAGMKGADRAMAKRIHEIVKANAPGLSPRTWYGMPAYADPAGKIVCFFQDAAKFKARYATFGFSDQANLDDSGMWPTSFALKELSPSAEARIAALVKKAVS